MKKYQMENKKEIVVEELHKPARRHYSRRKFDIRGIDETWQADLVEMQPFAQENRGHRYMLTVIDTFSKYAWAVPVKNKTGEEVAKAMKSILSQGRTPTNLHTDQGKEFYNVHFKNLMNKYKINLYSTYSNMKAAICERFNRTLKSEMWKKFSLQGSYKWLNILPDLVEAYNNRLHKTIGMKPSDVTAENANEVKKKYTLKVKLERKKPKFKVGDKVRVSRIKQVFEKGYTPNWSTEIFTVDAIVKTDPITYRLIDYQDQPIAGGFYEEELLKVCYPDIYLVEKILRRRGNQVYVKWLGFDNTHNSWINREEL